MFYSRALLFALVASIMLAIGSSFSMGPSMAVRSSRMNLKAALAPPGMKPDGSGGFKVAGEHPDEFKLEMDNGAMAIVRSYGCNPFTYITADGIEVMGTRKDAKQRDDSKPYAGGAPHCFPQFGPGALPQHGFARGMKFIPEERAKKLSFDRMIFKLEPTEETRKIWNYEFEYRVDITLRADCLEWDIIVSNKGDKPFDITTALHSYWDISSISNIEIQGPFKGAQSVNKVDNTPGVCDTDTLKITAHTDMLYKGVTGPVSIIDHGKKTKTTIERKGYPDTCVWSPFGNDAMGYDKFICVEPVQSAPLTIPVGKFKETKFYQKVTCTKL